MTTRTRVFLVDDHDLIRAGQRAVLGDRFDVVGEADTAEAAVEGILSVRPDVVLIDVRLGGAGHGASVVRRVLGRGLAVSFLAVSALSEAEEVGAMVHAGVIGYQLKSDTANLAQAIDMVAAGIPYFSRQLAAIVPQITAELSTDERAVMHRMAAGMTAAEVADRLQRPVGEIHEVFRGILERMRGDRA